MCNNRTKRYLFLLAAMLYNTATLLPAEKIRIDFKDGEIISFNLESHPVISIYGNEIYMVIDGKAVSTCLFDDIRKITFDKNISSAPILPIGQSEVHHEGNVIVLTGFKPDGLIRVIGLDGMTKISSEFDSKGCYRFNTADLPSGIYILVTDRQIIKIMVGE